MPGGEGTASVIDGMVAIPPVVAPTGDHTHAQHPEDLETHRHQNTHLGLHNQLSEILISIDLFNKQCLHLLETSL